MTGIKDNHQWAGSNGRPSSPLSLLQVKRASLEVMTSHLHNCCVFANGKWLMGEQAKCLLAGVLIDNHRQWLWLAFWSISQAEEEGVVRRSQRFSWFGRRGLCACNSHTIPIATGEKVTCPGEWGHMKFWSITGEYFASRVSVYLNKD